MVIEEIAARARREDYRKFPGLSVKRVVAAVGCVAPRNLRVADAGWIGIHGASVVVDRDLPIRAAGRVGAGRRAALRFTAGGVSRQSKRQRSNSGS